nr:hypothetical protein Iba_chr14cCG10910 [Ipomoea batatas]
MLCGVGRVRVATAYTFYLQSLPACLAIYGVFPQSFRKHLTISFQKFTNFFLKLQKLDALYQTGELLVKLLERSIRAKQSGRHCSEVIFPG